MIQKIVINNGKKYVVNAPGWNDDVGPGAPTGVLWLKSITDSMWYEVKLTGSPASSFSVNPTPLTLSTNDLGYQLLQSTNGNVYQVYLSGSGAGVTVLLNTSPWPVDDDFKSNLFLQSKTDGFGYSVVVQGTTLTIDNTRSSSIMY